jgi:hypothetical protein
VMEGFCRVINHGEKSIITKAYECYKIICLVTPVRAWYL